MVPRNCFISDTHGKHLSTLSPSRYPRSIAFIFSLFPQRFPPCKSLGKSPCKGFRGESGFKKCYTPRTRLVVIVVLPLDQNPCKGLYIARRNNNTSRTSNFWDTVHTERHAWPAQGIRLQKHLGRSLTPACQQYGLCTSHQWAWIFNIPGEHNLSAQLRLHRSFLQNSKFLR